MKKTRSNGEGSIRHRNDGRYEVRITTGINFSTGEPERISRYADTEEAAVKLLHKLSYQKEMFPNINKSITLGEWLDFWLETYMKHSLKQSTYLSYESYARIHFKPTLGNFLLKAITPRLLQQYYNHKAEAEGLSPKTIVNLNLYLHKALGQAVLEGYLPSNPASNINLPRGRKPQIEILTRDEQAHLLRASYQHRYGVFIRLVLTSGLRMGELLGLRWEDLDLHANLLHIRRTLNRLNKIGLPTDYAGPKTEIVIDEPKSQNSIRSIPLLPAAVQDLLGWRGIQEQDRSLAGDTYQLSGFIVTNPQGGYIEPRTFKDYYNQMLTLAGLRHFTFHALRHTFASRALEQGMDAKTLSILLGHASVSFTLDTYTHVLNDHKWEGMQLMEELYALDSVASTPAAYPILITPEGDASYHFSAPDFPQVQFYAPSMEEGLAQIGDELREALVSTVYPPTPSRPEGIVRRAGQILLQLPV